MKLLAVLQIEFKRLLKEKIMILILLLMPLAFIIPVGMAFGNQSDDTEEKGQPLLVIDYDGGKQALDLTTKLDENFIIEQNLAGDIVEQVQLEDDPDCAHPGPACDEKIARVQLKASSRALALLIPAGLSTAYERADQTSITLLYDPAGDINLVQQVEGVIRGASISISLEKQVMQGMKDMEDLSAIGSDEIQNAVKSSAKTVSTQDVDPAIDLEKIYPENITERKPPNALQRSVPGYTVMFVFLVTGLMSVWSIEEKRNGILRRLLSSPVSNATLLGGKLIYGLVLSFAQILVLFITSYLMFHLGLGKDILAFMLVSLALSITVTSLGLLAAAIKFPMSAITAPLVIGAMLGGCLFPRDLMPPLLRILGNLIPHSWAMSAYQDLLVRGYSLPQVLPEIGALMLFALIFFAIAVWRFDPLD